MIDRDISSAWSQWCDSWLATDEGSQSTKMRPGPVRQPHRGWKLEDSPLERPRLIRHHIEEDQNGKGIDGRPASREGL